MADAAALEQDAWMFAKRAVKCDQEGLYETAIFYYREACQALESAAEVGSQRPEILQKAQEYSNRAEQLKHIKQDVTTFAAPHKTQDQLGLERAKFLVEQAFEEDAGENKEEATELYMQAVEMCLKLRGETQDKDLNIKLTKLAEQALERAEHLKGQAAPKPAASPTSPSKVNRGVIPAATHKIIPGPLGFSLRDDDAAPSRVSNRNQVQRQPAPPSGGGGGYSREEIQVLRTTSMINGREYVPFMSVDVREKFAYPVTYSDKHGKLTLSPKQKNKFSRWVRPEDYLDNPQMIMAISSFSIKQTIVSDCSFVASLAISAQYERRFKKKLITSIIFPQNRNGDPQYNPCGKYMVKLNINGVHRKVVIDDYLPMSRDGDLLCSYSNNRNELWVSLLEKAYMKVMGGYDFPGSNSNIDLHALTGWIPERVAIRPGSDEFNPQKEFDKILDRFHKGHCLVTIATGEMSEANADRAGLVPTHAYAMLDIRKVKGYNLFQLKNPWSHLRWKGNFSELDTVHWTADMRKALNFDPNSASMYDNGVFWIDYESLMKFFDVIYINWNPELFQHTTCVHHTWIGRDGPKKDAYNIGENPQYKLEVKATKASPVWILLTRHITDKDDFANNREFITVLVYKSNGKRIFYPHDPAPYKDGVRINSPHYLCKMIEEPGTRLFTLVVSQYEKSATTHYTLRVFSTADFSLTKVPEPYRHEKEVTGHWTRETSGGCQNNAATYSKNPVYQVNLDNNSATNHLLVELKGPKQYSVGFDIVCVGENVTNATGSFKKVSSGTFRPGFCVLELENIPGGIYNITPCTFYPNQEGPFFLNFSSSSPMKIALVRK